MIDGPSRFIEPTTPASRVAFGRLSDLAMLQAGSTSIEVCEACSTVNMSTAQLFCGCCSHKLSAFYAAPSFDKPVPHVHFVPERTFAWSLAAFCLVMTSLAIMTTLGVIA